MHSLSLVYYKVKRLIPVLTLPKSTSKEDFCCLDSVTHLPLALNHNTVSLSVWHQGWLFCLISGGICWYNLCSFWGCMTRCGLRNEAGWHRPCANEPERAGQKLYLDPVYIFQGTVRGKSWNFWYLITEGPGQRHTVNGSFKADSFTTSGMVVLLVLVTLCHFLLRRAGFFDVFRICTCSSSTEQTKLRSQ